MLFYPSKVLQARECASTLYSFIIFSLGLTFETLKELGTHHFFLFMLTSSRNVQSVLCNHRCFSFHFTYHHPQVFVICPPSQITFICDYLSLPSPISLFQLPWSFQFKKLALTCKPNLFLVLGVICVFLHGWFFSIANFFLGQFLFHGWFCFKWVITKKKTCSPNKS